MYRYYCRLIVPIVFQISVLWLATWFEPANAQPLINFVDLNQSREFFENGQDKFEREIEKFEADRELPQIRLPENCFQLNRTKDRSLIDRNKPKSKSISDSASIYPSNCYF